MTQKIVTSIATGSLLLALLTPLTFAQSSIYSGNNARGSENNISVSNNSSNTIWQQNMSSIRNQISMNSNTGNNHASDNHGEVSTQTGNTNSNVHIETNANMNSASITSNPSQGNNTNNPGNGNWMQNKNFFTQLWGNKEVPGPGDQDGYGTAKVSVNKASNNVCINMHVGNIATATAAHIHKAPMGASGPVVLPLPTPNVQGMAQGCMQVDPALAQEMRNNPEQFYVNVHNSEYPNGAIRGQLSN